MFRHFRSYIMFQHAYPIILILKINISNHIPTHEITQKSPFQMHWQCDTRGGHPDVIGSLVLGRGHRETVRSRINADLHRLFLSRLRSP